MIRPAQFFGIVFLGSWLAGLADAEPAVPKPNIVIIMADDMGYRCWGLPDLEIIHARM